MVQDDLYRRAEHELDIYNYELSRHMFRQAALIAEPTRSQLANLSIAEEEDIVKHRRDICNCYPHSFNCKISLIQTLDWIGQSQSAVALASELLTDLELSDSEEFQARLVRLSSAFKHHTSITSITEDMTYIWNAGENNHGARQCRRAILKVLTACSTTSIITTLESLVLLPIFSDNMILLINHKINELEAMQACLNEGREPT